MPGEVASIAVEMTPYVSAAFGAYGGAVLAKVRDDAADATVGLGRRLLSGCSAAGPPKSRCRDRWPIWRPTPVTRWR